MKSSDTAKQKKRSLKNIKSKRKMSDLEKLPVELLEKVFLFCMNPDLPRSSPVIAGKLSSSVVYTKTIIAAFGPSWRRIQPWVDEQHEDLMLGGADPVVQVRNRHPISFPTKIDGGVVCAFAMSLGYSRSNFSSKGFSHSKRAPKPSRGAFL